MKKIGYTTEIIKQKEVVINLTEKCNNMCLNCPNSISFLKNKINKNEVEKFIKENINKNTDRITLIGGEPTIANNFFEIINKIKKINKNIIIQINSNGRMFYYESFIKKLLKYDINKFDIHIALYGSNSKIHDEITQVKNSFKQTIIGIQKLLNHEFKIQIRIIISKLNYKDLINFPKLINFKFKNKIAMFNFVGMDIIGNAKINKKKLAISHLDIAPYIEKTIKQLKEQNIKCKIHLLPKNIFKKKYHKYAIKSGCVDGAFIQSYKCSECSYYNECPKLLKSYVKIFKNKEHLPCIL